MAGRRTVAILLLAGLCSAAVAAVLSVLGISDWRLKAVAAAGAAIATYLASLAQSQLSAALDERRKQRAAIAQSVFTPTGQLPRVDDIADPIPIGVHAAPHPAVAGRLPSYVLRDVDPEVRGKLSRSGFVLLTGDAAAGKTRTAYEAMRAVLPSHVFIAPTGIGDVPEAMKAAQEERECVLWLDSLQRYLGAEGVNSRGIAELLAGEDHHRVVLATLRAVEESRLFVLARSLSGGQLTRDGQAVLELVNHRIVVKREFSQLERSRAAALSAGDPRLADALRHAHPYGIAEYLSSGPRLYIEWTNAWERGANPCGAALVAAAVDCRLAGFAAPLPGELLDELKNEYITRHGGEQLRPEPAADAWRWATDLRDSGSSPLWSTGNGGYDVFDYLVDVRTRESAEPVPESTVRAALRFAAPADATVIAATAWHQGRPNLAEDGFRAAYNELLGSDGPDSPATLASRSDLAVTMHAMGRLPDAEAEYRAILTGRTGILGAEHPETLASRNNLATVLHAQRRLDEAEAEYRTVLEIRTRTLGAEHPSTLVSRNNLGVVLKDLGRLEEAEAQLEEAYRLRSLVLGPDHRHTVISRDNLAAVRRKLSAG